MLIRITQKGTTLPGAIESAHILCILQDDTEGCRVFFDLPAGEGNLKFVDVEESLDAIEAALRGAAPCP